MLSLCFELPMDLNQLPPGLKRHPLNTGFAPPVAPHASRTILDDRAQQHFFKTGWLHIPQVVSGEALDVLRARIDAHEAGEPDSVLAMDDGYTLTYGADRLSFSRNLALKDQAIRDFALSPMLAGLVTDLLGPGARLYWDQAVYKKPGEAQEFPWHQDNGYTFLRPQAYVTFWLALADADEDNGCPWVIPGLHRYGTLAHANAPYGLEIEGIGTHKDAAQPCPAQVGDIVAFSSLTPHRTGPNLTPRTRKAYILQYMPEGTQRIGPDGMETPLNDDAANPKLPA